VVLLAGWLLLPLAHRLFAATADGGSGAAKALALFLAGYVAWLLAYLGGGGAWCFGVAALLLVVVGVLAWWRSWRDVRAWLRMHWRMVLAVEVVGLLVYAGLLLFRGYTADITTIEKYTNMAIVNSIVLEPQVPPRNAWFGGRPLNYYYFGHWCLAMVSQISGMPSNDLVIFATPLLAALSAQCCITIIATALPATASMPATGSATARGTRRGIGWSLVGIFLLLFAGSLNEALHGLAHWREEWQRTFFESRITPAIVDALAPYGNLFEFPAVSLLWGDFHAHFLGIPLLLVVVALFVQRMAAPGGTAAWGWYATVALFLGCSSMTNSWQYPTLLVLWLAVVWWRWLRQRHPPLHLPLAESLLLPVGSLVAVLPFVLTFESFAVVPPTDSPLQPVPLLPGALLVWSPVGTTLAGLLRSIGLPLLVAGVAALALVRGRGWHWVGLALLVGILSSLYRPAGLVLLPCIAAGLWLALATQGGAAMGGLLLMVGSVVLLGCEYVMLPDHSLSRSNTIFKFYIQVWVLLSLAAPMLLAAWSSAVPRSPFLHHLQRGGVALVLVLVLVGGGIFPLLRGRQWLRYHGDQWWGLHGMAQVEAYQPDEAAAIAWLRAQPGSGGVLETIGNSSNGTDQRLRPARFSSLTGRHTPIGWMGHTAQWNNYTTSEHTREIYRNSVALVHGFPRTGNINDVYVLMAVNNLEYVAFGSFEAQQWQEPGRALLAAHLPLRWQSGQVQLFGRPAQFPDPLVWLHPTDWSDAEVSTDGRGTRFHWMLGERGKLSIFSQQRAVVQVRFAPVNSVAAGQVNVWQGEQHLLRLDVVPYQSQPRILWLQVEPGVTTLEVQTDITPLTGAGRSVTLAIAPLQIRSSNTGAAHP
jgi:YYY domain-containing protein